MLSFEIAGEDDVALDRVDATLAATAAVQKAHPDLRVEQVGSASANKAFDKTMGEDFKRAETLSIPFTLLIRHMSEPIDVRVNPDRTLAVVEIPLHGIGESDEALASLAALREDVVPATIERVSGTTVNVSGQTAGSKDFNDTMKSHLPIVFGFVLGAAFLLLLMTFRSLVIPIKAS